MPNNAGNLDITMGRKKLHLELVNTSIYKRTRDTLIVPVRKKLKLRSNSLAIERVFLEWMELRRLYGKPLVIPNIENYLQLLSENKNPEDASGEVAKQ